MAVIDVGAKVRFDSSIFTTRFPNTCSIEKCKGSCCEAGAIIDGEEKAEILSLKDELLPLLRRGCKDFDKWFVTPSNEDLDRVDDSELTQEERDDHFCTGKGHGYCHFFNKDFGCALQKLAESKGLHKWAYKPSACVLYPLLEDSNEVIRADEDFDETMWCCKKHNHSSNLFRSCKEELEFVAGKKAVEELEKLEAEFIASPSTA